MKEAFFMFLGALITTGFSYFLELLKNAREDSLYLKEKREDTYKSILEIYYQYRQDITNGVDSKGLLSSLPHLLEKHYPAINIYASEQVKNIYNTVMHSKANKEKELIEAIRKELGVKD